MTTPPTADVRVPLDKPPEWANSWMRWALNTPGLQRMIGQGVALLKFQGRKSGKLFSIPVSYDRQGDIVTIITKRQREWWHNFESPIEVEIRLAGRMHTGTAKIQTDADQTLQFMIEYLKKRPIDAKAYGLARDKITREKIARIIPHIVVIQIAINPNE